jgi:hypothetical protein
MALRRPGRRTETLPLGETDKPNIKSDTRRCAVRFTLRMLVISGPLLCGLGLGGQLGRGAQHTPGHVGAKFLAAHQAASGQLDLRAALGGNLTVKLVFRRQTPLRHSARRDAKPDCKLGAAADERDRFFDNILSGHALTLSCINIEGKLFFVTVDKNDYR